MGKMGEAEREMPIPEATQQMLRVAGDLLDAGVLTVDTEMCVREWNTWLENASGLRAEDVIGKRLSEVAPDLIAPAGEAAFATALGGGPVVHAHRFHQFLLRLPSPPGHPEFEHMQQNARIAPLRTDDGRVCGAVAFIADVTERVAGEEELRVAMRAAQAADRAKSDFLAAMSHELRTPIGAISGYADLLIEEFFGPLNDAQREHLVRVKSVGDHLLRIVEEILSFARLEARREVADITDVNAWLVVSDAAAAVEPLARKKGLQFHVRRPNQRVMLRTDDTKLRQILINLLGNAVKFTERGSITLELFPPEPGKHLRISVTDTGLGIADDDMARIFDPFVQARSALSRTHGGTGLGLSVSRQLARLLGGDITVVSAAGKGSTFTVSLPFDPGAAASDPGISLLSSSASSEIPV